MIKQQQQMAQTRELILPVHTTRRYEPVGACIYCGSVDGLTDEHIIPFAAGGRWVLPSASCKTCARVTSKFEGELLRTVLGPLRMLYDMPSRRKKDRPEHIELKVKYPTSTDWEIARVDRSICPFLVGLPLYPMPDLLGGANDGSDRSSATNKLWIRGAAFWRNRDEHLQWLCQELGAVAVMPTATVHTEPVCLSVAKIAHSFAVAELGLDKFEAFLPELIRTRDLSDRASYIGGGAGDEQASQDLHDVVFDPDINSDSDVIAVSVRVMGVLETPTYQVAVGRRR